MKTVTISGAQMGEGSPCFIIAEAGVNHNGDLSLAKKLVEVAKTAGADAVKFQTFDVDVLIIRSADKARYQKEATGPGETQFEMIRKLQLTEGDFEKLAAYTQEKGMIFLSSPFDKGSVDLLDRLNVPAFKVPSGEITNFPLLKHIAGKGKPIIVSTGMATLREVEEALQIIQNSGGKDIILLHCVSSYPASMEDMNLRAIETLRHTFNLPVGLSDHTVGITIPIAAVALGACVIEKHFTLDRNLPGPDHRASLEPDELRQMTKAIRDIEKAMGDGIKRPAEQEEEVKRAARRSIVAIVDIPQGTTITEDMLGIKRPGTGIEPQYLHKVVGSVARSVIGRDEVVTADKLEK